jgi:hypothetical protein
MDRKYAQRVERRSWASFKVKLAIICSLVVAGVLGLMFLEMTEERKRWVWLFVCVCIPLGDLLASCAFVPA